MAKAQPIAGLDPSAPTRDSLPAIFSVRITELYELAQYIPDAARARELHDMRIAAKRVRYCFEFFLHCFDDDFKNTLKAFKQLQDYLGEIHDCDAWVDYLRTQLAEAFKDLGARRKSLKQYDAASAELRAEALAFKHALKLGPAQGLLMMLSDLVLRRRRLHRELLTFWRGLERRRFRDELTAAVARAAQERVAP